MGTPAMTADAPVNDTPLTAVADRLFAEFRELPAERILAEILGARNVMINDAIDPGAAAPRAELIYRLARARLRRAALDLALLHSG